MGWHCDSRLVLVAIATIMASGCARERAPVRPDSSFVVRLLTSEHLSRRWERAGERALGRLAVELDADVLRLRCTPGELSHVMEHDAAFGAPDLVFFVGSGFESAVYTEARLHPEIRFVLVNGTSSADNVAAIDFIVDEAAYLGGVAAGVLSSRGTTGVIRGPGRPWLYAVEEGYAAGFTAEWPRAEVIDTAGPTAPWDLVRAGVKVALYASEVADRAVLAAAHDAGLLLIGVDGELVRADSEVVVAAISVDVPEAALRIAREVKDGSFRGMVYAFDLGSGVVDLEIGPFLREAQHAQVLLRLDEARAEVVAGIVEIENLGL